MYFIAYNMDYLVSDLIDMDFMIMDSQMLHHLYFQLPSYQELHFLLLLIFFGCLMKQMLI